MGLTEKTQVKEMAKRVLNLYWDYKIPVNIEMIANKVGAEINYQPVLAGGEDIVGRFDVVNNQAILSICNNVDLNITTERQKLNFILAHELGHFVLGHGGGCRDTIKSFKVNHSDKYEFAANLFAVELLTPQRLVDFVIQNKNITNIEQLSNLFDVSIGTMKYSLKNSGWLNN